MRRLARYSDAEAGLRQALRKAQEFGWLDARVAVTWNNLGALYQETGRCLEAKNACDHSLAIWRKVHAGSERDSLKTASNLVAMHLECGELERAERPYRCRFAGDLSQPDLNDAERARVLNSRGAMLASDFATPRPSPSTSRRSRYGRALSAASTPRGHGPEQGRPGKALPYGRRARGIIEKESWAGAPHGGSTTRQRRNDPGDAPP